METKGLITVKDEPIKFSEIKSIRKKDNKTIYYEMPWPFQTNTKYAFNVQFSIDKNILNNINFNYNDFKREFINESYKI